MNTKTLFLAYQDQASRQWAPVARVTRANGQYRLVYTTGALSLDNFQGFGRMTQLDTEYVSSEIFPLLSNRVLPKNRPEYAEYLSWLGLSNAQHDALEELSRTGGLRATDTIELIPCPERNALGNYEVFFFSRGLSHFQQSDIERVSELNPGDPLFLMKDIQNDRDELALLLRTADPPTLVGYAPKYYAHDIHRLAGLSGASKVRVQVEQVNRSAPLQYKLLCKMTCVWPESFSPCDSDQFRPITKADLVAA